jgi:peptidoglycan/LPS O-acetylase OafA/YrhL
MAKASAKDCPGFSCAPCYHGEMNDHRSANLDALTGLRFVAASFIAIAHWTGAGYTPFGFLRYDVLAMVGMPLFFTLSGFILHYVYSSGFVQSWTVMAREFAVARFSRLYPLFAVLLLTYLLFTPLGKTLGDSPWILLSYATMTGSWWYWTVNGASIGGLPFGWSWSISTEVFFYVVYALVLYRISGIRRLSVAVSAFTVFCVLSYVFLIIVIEERDAWTALAKATLPNFISLEQDIANSFLRWLLYISPYFRLLEFIAGVLTCQIYLLLRKNVGTISRRWREVLGWAGVAWIAVALSHIPLTNLLPPSAYECVFALNLLNFNFLLAPGCCALTLALAVGRSSLQAVLAIPAIVRLGEISYSIYLAHPLVAQIFFVPKDNEFPLISYVIAFFFLFVISDAMYRHIELPSKRFLRRLFGASLTHTAAGKARAS